MLLMCCVVPAVWLVLCLVRLLIDLLNPWVGVAVLMVLGCWMERVRLVSLRVVLLLSVSLRIVGAAVLVVLLCWLCLVRWLVFLVLFRSCRLMYCRC